MIITELIGDLFTKLISLSDSGVINSPSASKVAVSLPRVTVVSYSFVSASKNLEIFKALPTVTTSNPKTGDNVGIYVVMLVVALIGIVSIVVIKKGNKAGQHLFPRYRGEKYRAYRKVREQLLRLRPYRRQDIKNVYNRGISFRRGKGFQGKLCRG